MRCHRRTASFALAIALGASCSCSTLQASDLSLETITRGFAGPTHAASFPDAFQENMIVPVWDKHHLVYHLLDISNGETPNVTLFDENGETAREARIWFPVSAAVRLADVRTTDSGAVLASGYTEQTDATVAHFIAETDLKGDVAHVIWTGSFMANFVCSASDGTVWGLGHEVGKEEAGEDFMTLRHYSFSQGLLQLLLPRRAHKYWLDLMGGQTAFPRRHFPDGISVYR